MIKKSTIKIQIFFFSILLQGISILQYLLKDNEIYIINWLPQYIGVVLFSILLTTMQLFLQNDKYKYYIFILRYVLILIIHFPVGIYIGLKQMFLISFLLDLSFILPFPINGIISIISTITIYLVSTISQHWGMDNPLPELHDFIFALFFTLLIIFVFTFFKYFYDSYSFYENHANRLNKTINNLTDANNGYQHYIRVIEEKSIEDERNRIIREIHDSIGYTLTTVMMLSMSTMESEKNNLNNSLREVLTNINTYAKSGLNDMRIVLRILKIKTENNESDLIQLRKMVKAFQKATNINIRLEFSNVPQNFNSQVSHTVFRLIQEGMINSLRHGVATNIDIFLFIQNKELIITLRDNGKGFDEITPGIGLKGIRERLDKINGDFKISNSILGTTLRINIPMDEELVNE